MTWVGTPAQCSRLHFVREGEVFAHIPAFETQRPSNGRRVRLLDGDSGSFSLVSDHKCVWEEQLLDRKECAPAVHILSAETATKFIQDLTDLAQNLPFVFRCIVLLSLNPPVH